MNRVKDSIALGRIPTKATRAKYDLSEKDINDLRDLAGFASVDFSKPIKTADKFKMAKETKYPVAINLEKVKEDFDNNDKINSTSAEIFYKNIVNMMDKMGAMDDNLIDLVRSKKFITYINKLANANTRKMYMSSVLALIDKTDIKNHISKSLRQEYVDQHELLKHDAYDHAKKVKETEVVVKFSDLKDRIEKEFSPTSDEVMLINMYDVATMRNDFDDVKINKEGEKWIDMKTGMLHMNKYSKTFEKYGAKTYKLPKEFINLLKKSLDARPRDTLIKKRAKSLWATMKTGVNEIRHAKISEMLSNKKLSPSEKILLQNKMLHSPIAQEAYKRKLKSN